MAVSHSLLAIFPLNWRSFPMKVFYMKKIISLMLVAGLLSSCTLFRPHKNDVIQGNVLTQEEVHSLHRGMSTEQVKDVLGTPLLVNLFAPDRIDYIYTYQAAYTARSDHRVTCIFRHGRLADIIES
jgi:outer membrane protein assembly factor BamE